MGAKVQYCGHDATFIADIYKIGNCNVVRTDIRVLGFDSQLERPAVNPTHHLVDFPAGGFWRKDLGVFVVPEDQVRDLREEKSDGPLAILEEGVPAAPVAVHAATEAGDVPA